MPVIRHRTGPLAGTEQTIDQTVERITFGRDPAVCDVVYPADLTTVARRHFALVRRPSGEWTFDDFGKPYVGINGMPAEVSQAVDSGDAIELGQPGGPSFEFISGGKDLGNALPATAVQYAPESSYATAGKARRMAMMAGAFAVIIAGGAAGYSYLSSQSGAKLEKAVAELADNQAKVAADSIGPAVRDRLAQSAYLIMKVSASGQFMGGGTGFPVAGDTLGTNAHVAEIFNDLKPGEKLFVRAPGATGKQFEVLEVKLHPGYAAYIKYLQEDPIFVTAKRDCSACGANRLSGVPNYDVALVKVAKDANLGPIVEIASQKTLEEMRPGMPVGVAGFPMENIMGRDILGMAAVPNLRTGMVNAVTDMFFLPGDDAHRRLITHNIGIAGGSSGSPMVGSDGKLVALVNAGNMFFPSEGVRTPSGALINYAQRADLLRELMDGKADENLKAEHAYWNQQTANFARGSEYLIPHIVSLLKERGVSPQLAGEFKGQLTKAESFVNKDKDGKDVNKRQKIHPFGAKANTGGIFMAYARGGLPVQLYIVVNGKIVLQEESGSFFPRVIYPNTPQELTGEIYIVGGDQDVDYTLVHYTWSPGQS